LKFKTSATYCPQVTLRLTLAGAGILSSHRLDLLKSRKTPFGSLATAERSLATAVLVFIVIVFVDELIQTVVLVPAVIYFP
jgi:hypothetical protein